MPRRLLATLVGFLALVGVSAAIGHYLVEPYNPGFLRYPAVTALHVVLGGAFLALAPFQFVARLRRRRLGLHRRLGRGLVVIGLLLGGAGLFMALAIPIAGWVERIVIGGFGLYFVVALGNGSRQARAGAVARHREWMIRAFAVGLAVASQRLIIVASFVLVGEPTTERRLIAVTIVSYAAFVLHAAAAEVWIRHTRPGSARRADRPSIGAPSRA